MLLHNKHSWWSRANDRHRPILMICYTNHALDQFLEYCIDVCGLTQRVVRVGGQSRSEKLDNFKLSKIKQQMRSTKQIDASIHHRIIDERRKLADLKARIGRISELYMLLTKGHGLLHFNVLEEYMSESQVIRFATGDKKGPNYHLLEWLGFYDKQLDTFEQKDDDENNDDDSNDEDSSTITSSMNNMNLAASNNG